MPRIIDVKRFKDAREHYNLTQQELAEKAKVSKKSIERIEQGHSPNQTTLSRIAAVLG